MAMILVVDDSGMSRRILRRILETAGYSVIEADNGLEAPERYVLERPDLVLLDMTMREMHGLEVLARLRELDPQARVIAATADIQRSTYDMVAEQGACGFIAKPFDEQRVLEAVGEALAKGA